MGGRGRGRAGYINFIQEMGKGGCSLGRLREVNADVEVDKITLIMPENPQGIILMTIYLTKPIIQMKTCIKIQSFSELLNTQTPFFF